MTNSLLRSVVRTATATEPNKRASTSTESKGSIIAPMEPDTRRKGSPTTLDLMSDLVGGSADFDPIPYLGYSFVRADAHDIPHKTTVIDVDKETGRVLLEYIHRQTEWVEPNILQEALLSREANDDGTNLWTFSTVLDHKTENNQVHVKIQWDNGDVTWEPLNSLRKDDPVTLAKYAHEKGITNERGWKWSRKINKRPKKLLRMLCINASQKGAARKTVKYKFGVQIPKHPMHALELDRLNGNTKWRDALQLEIDQLLKFETFLIYEKGQIDLENYTYPNPTSPHGL